MKNRRPLSRKNQLISPEPPWNCQGRCATELERAAAAREPDRQALAVNEENREGAAGFHGRLGMRAILALLVSTCLASAQEGPIVSRHGVGHDTWHAQFYSKLVKDDGGSCCNFNDCRPTLSRSVGDHYEVLVDGEWERVPWDTIRKVVAPDRGAHVCAPEGMHDMGWHIIYCVVLPPEG
jgi:hypothetical protein